MIVDYINEVICKFAEEEIKIKRKVLHIMLSSYNLTFYDAMHLGLITKEYIVDYFFSNSERNKYYIGGNENYFAHVLLKRISK